ncbi:hypothetical protein FB451DRAFT_603868 [Mycena latifolia]|nr:hypothetical protein FB451DRAFT_603868 [Mycena latifolia]
MSNIENEITFKSNPLFVFHDSRGIEAGAEHEQNSPLSTEYLWNFLEKLLWNIVEFIISLNSLHIIDYNILLLA